MEKKIIYWLYDIGGKEFADKFELPVMLVTVAAAAVLAYLGCKYIIVPCIVHFTQKTETEWDDHLLSPQVLNAVCQMMPAIVVALMLPKMFVSNETLYVWIKKFTLFYLVWSIVNVVNRLITGVYNGFDARNVVKIHSLKGTLQMVKLIVICMGIIIGAGILFDRSPVAILTAFGASAAVLMLVFKDTILGLVAGVQLTANKMLSKGDWIVCEKAGANGEVLDISLTTVKVRNWDNSVITIPPYNLVSESFQNYQPMRRLGARRVSRYIYIDVNSVRFLEEQELEALRADGLLTDDESASEERIVNLGLFRHHMESWLKNRRDILVKKGRTVFVMVRQLQSTPQGIPLELYCFTSRTDWKEYESVQDDIFDYVYAVLNKFGLRIFQAPSGLDLLEFRDNM